MEIIRSIQSIQSPFLDTLFTWVTDLADARVLLLIVVCVFWCADKRFGYSFLLTFASGLCVNVMFKNAVRAQRPSVRYSDTVRVLDTGHKYDDIYSFPSGHAQSATLSYGVLGKKLDRAYTIAGIFLVLLVAISRIYLGMHTLEDVIMGIAVGVVWAVIGFKLYDYIYSDTKPLLILLYAVPGVLSLLSLSKLWFGAYAQPDNTYIAAGSVFGVTAGALIEHLYIKFIPGQHIAKQIIKCIIGLLGCFLIYTFGEKIFVDRVISDLFTYSVLGLWITVGVPLFSKYVIERWRIIDEKKA